MKGRAVQSVRTSLRPNHPRVGRSCVHGRGIVRPSRARERGSQTDPIAHAGEGSTDQHEPQAQRVRPVPHVATVACDQRRVSSARRPSRQYGEPDRPEVQLRRSRTSDRCSARHEPGRTTDRPFGGSDQRAGAIGSVQTGGTVREGRPSDRTLIQAEPVVRPVSTARPTVRTGPFEESRSSERQVVRPSAQNPGTSRARVRLRPRRPFVWHGASERPEPAYHRRAQPTTAPHRAVQFPALSCCVVCAKAARPSVSTNVRAVVRSEPADQAVSPGATQADPCGRLSGRCRSCSTSTRSVRGRIPEQAPAARVGRRRCRFGAPASRSAV
jgi:hypothetical protein